MLINKWAEYSNDNQTYNIVGDDRIQRKATLLASYISLLFWTARWGDSFFGR